MCTRLFEASYRYVDRNGWRIVRVSCIVGQVADVQNMTAILPPPTADPVEVTLLTDVDTDETIGARMVVTTSTGDSLTVEATSQSPNQVLPIVPTGVTTTAAPTTPQRRAPHHDHHALARHHVGLVDHLDDHHLAPPRTVPCTAGFTTVAPTAVSNQPLSNGNNDSESRLTQPVTVTVTKSGNCSGLTLRYSRKAGFSYPPGQEVSTLFGASSIITFESLQTERWEDGLHVLRLYDVVTGTFMVSTFDFYVT